MDKYCVFPVCQCDVPVGLGCPYEPYDLKEPHNIELTSDDLPDPFEESLGG